MPAVNLSLVFFLAISAVAPCAADGPSPCPETPCAGQVRAGCPQRLSPLARPSDTQNYGGYYVGGGSAVHGEPRTACEGTWGWDYLGLIPKWVDLYWWHGARKQGGGGAYATDRK
jgi:hypothetical protein